MAAKKKRVIAILPISEEKAEELLQSFRRRHPKIAKWAREYKRRVVH